MQERRFGYVSADCGGAEYAYKGDYCWAIDLEKSYLFRAWCYSW